MAKGSDELQLALDKLRSSGLNIKPADLAKHGLTVLSAPQTAAMGFEALPALQFRYLDQRGKAMRPFPNWPEFYRLRYLRMPNTPAMATKKKQQRYTQPPGSGVCVYLPVGPDWTVVFENPEEPLIITEGELKAMKACQEGFPTIGLGGVFNYRSAKLGISLLPILEEIKWVKRNVYMIYDSDFRTNKHVCEALWSLANELYLRGAIPHFVPLPEVVKDGKTGLDDYLVSLSDVSQFVNLIADQAQPLTLSKSLWLMNEQVIYVKDPGLIIDIATGQKMSPQAFTGHHYATAQYSEQELRPDGSVSLKSVSAAKTWLSWPMRIEAAGLSYMPGASQIHNEKWNTWKGWGAEPVRGDVSLWLRLLDHLFYGSPEAKQWFIKWLAYPVKHPGTKLFTCSLIHGIKHGTGKSLIGYTMGRVYGKNFVEITENDLHASFNEWLIDKQFVLADDVTGSDKRREMDRLKKLISQKEVRINEKYIPSYSVPDCLNWLFTSNQPDAFFLEDNDRRSFIHEVPPMQDLLPEEFFMDYDCWLWSNQCGPAMHQWLLDVDLGDFNPSAPAMRTSAKDRMISDVRSDLGAWVRKLIADPDHVLRIGQVPVVGDMFTNKQLLDLYDVSGTGKVTANGMGRELRRAGVPQALEGATVLGPEGIDRFYIIRNVDKWLKASRAQVQKYLEKK